MVDATSSMSYEEKGVFAEDGLPDPRFYIDEHTEGGVLKDVKKVPKKLIKTGKKTRKQKRKLRRTKRLSLKFRKVR